MDKLKISSSISLLSSIFGTISKGKFNPFNRKDIFIVKSRIFRYGYNDTRQLKKSTIEDHLVELALKIREFSIDPYVSIEKQNQITKSRKETEFKTTEAYSK